MSAAVPAWHMEDGADGLRRVVLARLDAARRRTTPYRHWLLETVLPRDTAEAVTTLPFAPAAIEETRGKRETHNSLRVFFSPENQARFAVCAALAEVFQCGETIAHIERMCGAALDGGFLRIEYCQDTGDFWLEPHTDIGAKLVTMLIYLSRAPEAAGWGTDICDAEGRVIASAPGDFNRGLVFVPAADTWHCFRRRGLTTVRRSLIINYVKPEWRAQHELCYPDAPVRASGITA